MNYNYNKIAILGLGITGNSLYDYFIGKNANIVAWDDNSAVVLKALNMGRVLVDYKNWDYGKLDVIFISPGIALNYPHEHFVLQEAKKFNIPLICDVEAFLDIYNTFPTIAVSGTNGKSTTLKLLEHIFSSNLVNNNNHDDYKPIVGGNIGVPILSQGKNIENMEKSTHNKYINILELSSYQIDLMNKHHINCALMLNIQPDHLDHHGSFENYINAKKRLFLNQNKNDYAIINQECLHLCTDVLGNQNIIIIHNNYIDKGIYIKDSKLYDNYFANNEMILDFKSLNYLRGEHNFYNIAFAYATSRVYNINVKKIVEYILEFKGVKHRQTLVANVDNIKFINDSKATNPESTYYALKAFDNIALILGGKRKRDDLDILIPLMKKSVLKVFLIANRRTNKETIEIFAKILEQNNIDYEISYVLYNAVYSAYDFLSKHSAKSKTLLLSPACASMDQFNNFEHRGNIFSNIVKRLIKEKNLPKFQS